ncbi:MAG: hypothetical protein NWT02_06365 [Opitutales bacterium]|jgi:hypothetical protein|nr:hypothetical protein [Opitutales bacterium]MDP4694391.1 hypothetical protein [Opitutales bacterium]MDP4778285.1 hypothetical protein [Opitutales bacterium]MDP4884550.1 hypothetical protein [Opitutales bacterium]MDP5080714.1 hypothetical protein [Opitutales bacterium]
MKLLFSACLLVLATPLLAQTPSVSDIVNRARATVGLDTALDGLVTLNMTGSLEPIDSKMPAAALLIVARKPCSQRMEIRIDDMVETHILNGENGCIIRSNLQNGTSQMRPLTAAEQARVAFSTRQFFSFYRPDFKNGERISYEGIEQRIGIRCHKLVYAYPDGLTTVRYFSVDEDKLISTITENKVESVSVGVQNIGGIRFPEKIDYFEDGRKLHSIVLRSIVVNKPLQEGIFDIPKGQKK